MSTLVTPFPGASSIAVRHGSEVGDTQEISKVAVDQALRKSIEKRELYLRYQPKISVKSGEVCGFEALLRWESADFGHISPDLFIPIAEESHLIYDLGEWVLEEACRQATEWANAGVPIALAINISQAQFKDPEFLSKFNAAFDRYPMSKGLVEIEITETALMEDVDNAIRVCQQISNMHMGISIDDFGTGYSCLAQLTRLPVSKIKIDRSFVQNLEDPNGATIVRSIIRMAHELHKSVVAEGVETAGQFRYLDLHSCDEVQGHLFSPAISAEDVIGYVLTNRKLVSINKVAP